MNATILHESQGRIRIKLQQKRMTLQQADLLEEWLQNRTWARQVSIHERTPAVLSYITMAADRQYWMIFVVFPGRTQKKRYLCPLTAVGRSIRNLRKNW